MVEMRKFSGSLHFDESEDMIFFCYRLPIQSFSTEISLFYQHSLKYMYEKYRVMFDGKCEYHFRKSVKYCYQKCMIV